MCFFFVCVVVRVRDSVPYHYINFEPKITLFLSFSFSSGCWPFLGRYNTFPMLHTEQQPATNNKRITGR